MLSLLLVVIISRRSTIRLSDYLSHIEQLYCLRTTETLVICQSIRLVLQMLPENPVYRVNTLLARLCMFHTLLKRRDRVASLAQIQPSQAVIQLYTQH